MVQEAIALTIVFLAALYAVVNTYKFFFATKHGSCASGCSSCSVKQEVMQKVHAKKFDPKNLTFNPEDLATN